MKKTCVYFVCLLWICCSNSCAQSKPVSDSTFHNGAGNDSVFKHVNFIPGNYTYMDVDVLDNIYLITVGKCVSGTAFGPNKGSCPSQSWGGIG